MNGQLAALQAGAAAAEQKIKRLFQGVESGILELDDGMKKQIAIFKGEHERAKAVLEGAQVRGRGAITIDAVRADTFSHLMTGMLSNAETQAPALKAYLRTMLQGIVVGRDTIRIEGSKSVVASAITGQHSARANIHGLGPAWRARRDSNS